MPAVPNDRFSRSFLGAAGLLAVAVSSIGRWSLTASRSELLPPTPTLCACSLSGVA